MKKLILIFIYVVLTFSVAEAQWNVQLNTDNFTNLSRISFVDSLNGWAIGLGPYFYTEDGGNNWYLYDEWETLTGTDIVFVNQDTGFIASGGGIINRTVDGGLNWIPVQSPVDENILELFFSDKKNGWATLGQYSDGEILHTSNYGISWEIQSICNDCLDNISNLYFINKDTGWAAGMAISNDPKYSFIKRTEDGGENWVTLDSTVGSFPYYHDIYFQDSLNGWIAGAVSNYEYLLLRTNNGGLTWESQELPINSYGIPYSANCVFFTNDSVGWIGTGFPGNGNHGAIYLTKDGGNNWSLQQEFAGSGIMDLQMLNQNLGWSAGGFYIHSTTDGDTILITDIFDKNDIDKSVVIYPNPVANNLKLIFVDNLKMDSFTITLFNAFGEVVFNEGKQSIDQNSYIDFDISHLNSGIYLISIEFSTIGAVKQSKYFNQKIIKL